MSETNLSHSADVQDARSWVAVNTHAHREHIAVENLRRQSFVTYCPLIARKVRRGRRLDNVLRPLFPGYLFVEVQPDRQRWRPILSTIGVRALVRIADRPGVVPSALIEALKKREIDGAISIAASDLSCGQSVRISHGAMAGLVGTIVELGEKQRIVLLMQLLNQEVRVQVDRTLVATL